MNSSFNFSFVFNKYISFYIFILMQQKKPNMKDKFYTNPHW